MLRLGFSQKNIFTAGLMLILIGVISASFAQTPIDCSKVLDQQPNFVDHKLLPTDSLLQNDIRILKHCGDFDSIDSELLKGTVLSALMRDQVNAGKPATYRTIIDFVSDFRKTQEYREFRDGVVMYRNLENKKVSLKDWDTDQQLFVRMGFTVSDLDDFKEYISSPTNSSLTYKEAYKKYMNEIEGLKGR